MQSYCDTFRHSKEMIDRTNNKKFLWRKPTLQKRKLSMKTLIEEFDPVALKNLECESRQNN